MEPIITVDEKNRRVAQLCGLLLAFIALSVGLFYALRWLKMPSGTLLQQGVFTLGGALLLAGLATGFIYRLRGDDHRYISLWACPLAAAGISLYLMTMTYAYLGVWPLGEKSIMLVDMHHQYAPMLSELRHILLGGDGFPFSYHIGLGANFFPAFAYYLASPFNILLVLFPEAHLTEGILLITLLKNALAAGAFAACAQYLFRRRDARIVTLSVMYSMMLYMLAYSWNIMWLDVVALLPLVVLAMEHMLRTGKYLPYTLLLAVALFANYYIGFMLCVFLVLYMVVWLVRRRRNWRSILWGCGRFAAASLLAGGLAAALLVPTAFALGRTSAAGDIFPAFATNFSLFDWVGRLFYGATPTIRSGNLPNLYCGLAVVLLVPLYFLQTHIPLRRRLGYGGLLAVMLCSCTLTQWDLVWHGLHTPNDLPYRYSFLCCFVLLLLAGYTLTRLEHIQPRHIGISLCAAVVYLVVWEKFGGDKAPEPWLLYVNLFLLAVYALILLIGALKKLPRRAFSALLLTVVCGELLLGSAGTIETMNKNEYYTSHAHYLYNAATEADTAAIERAQELAQEETAVFGAFSRMEYLPRDTCLDPALHHYNGLTTFASSNPYSTTRLMGDLGYAINGVNSYLYHSFVPAVDALFGVRYVVLEMELTAHPKLTLVDSVTALGTTRYIYRFDGALPLGYMASENIRYYQPSEYAPFLAQQQLYDSLRDDSPLLYSYPTLTAAGDSTVSGNHFQIYEHTEEETFTAIAEEDGQYYAYVDCRAAETIEVSTYREDGTSLNNWTVTSYEPYIIDLGTLTAGQRMEAFLQCDGAASGNVYFAHLNADALDSQLTALAEGGLHVTEATNSTITGTVTADRDGLLLLSLPYDSGWTADVSGTPGQILSIGNYSGDGALMAVRVPAGEHTVTLTYKAPGQTTGLIISLISLVALFSPWIWK